MVKNGTFCLIKSADFFFLSVLLSHVSSCLNSFKFTKILMCYSYFTEE